MYSSVADATRCNSFWEPHPRVNQRLDEPGRAPKKGHHAYLADMDVPARTLLHEYMHIFNTEHRDVVVYDKQLKDARLAYNPDAIFALNFDGGSYMDMDTCGAIDTL